MIRKFLASLVVLTILMIVPIFSLVYALLDSYLDTDFYSDKSVITEVHGTLTSYIGMILAENIKASTGKEFMDSTEITEQISSLISAETLMQTSQSIMDQLNQSPLPETLKIDITEINENLPKVTQEVFISYINGLEQCTAEEEAELLEAGEDAMLTCLPAELNKEEVLESMSGTDTSTGTAYEGIPNEIELDLTVLSPETRYMVELVIQKNTLLKAGLIGTYFLLVALVALIIFKPIKSVLKWTGNTLFWSGFPLAMIYPLMKGTMELSLPRIAESSEYNLEMLQKGAEIITTFIGFVAVHIMWQGIVLAILGAIMFFVGVFIKEKK